MNPDIKKFLEKESLCSLSVLLSDGSPHSAALHYSFSENPFKLYFQTSNTTVKARPFLNGEVGSASVVIGFSEKDWVTYQLRGKIKIISNPTELEAVSQLHYAKHPESEKRKGPNTVFFEFTPNWWRYTDFNTHPLTIIEG